MNDQKEYQSRLEEILAEWDLDKDLAPGTGYKSTISGLGEDTITISSTLDNMSITSPYTFANAIGTTTTTTTAPWTTFNTASGSTKIQLDGENADIRVNDWSLVDAVKRIEQRLGLYQPNPELEQEWAELRELGEQYRKLEQHIRDKQATWDRLKAMPAPEIE